MDHLATQEVKDAAGRTVELKEKRKRELNAPKNQRRPTNKQDLEWSPCTKAFDSGILLQIYAIFKNMAWLNRLID